MDYYANAVRAEPGICWRMVSRQGWRKGSPMDCPEPVRWMGRTMVGKKRMRLYSCDGHVEGLEDVRALGPVHRAFIVPQRSVSKGLIELTAVDPWG
jgi:hypothetical protein